MFKYVKTKKPTLKLHIQVYLPESGSIVKVLTGCVRPY